MPTKLVKVTVTRHVKHADTRFGVSVYGVTKRKVVVRLGYWMPEVWPIGSVVYADIFKRADGSTHTNHVLSKEHAYNCRRNAII